jgi:hypothetical protein
MEPSDATQNVQQAGEAAGFLGPRPAMAAGQQAAEQTHLARRGGHVASRRLIIHPHLKGRQGTPEHGHKKMKFEISESWMDTWKVEYDQSVAGITR